MLLRKIMAAVSVFVFTALLVSCPAVVDPDRMDDEISSILMNYSGDNTIHSFSAKSSDNLQFVFDHSANIESYENEDSSGPDKGKIHLILPPASITDSILPHVELGKKRCILPVRCNESCQCSVHNSKG